ncbi:MAG: hypothetical protein WC076_10920 [Terrimicrobiaceae bacterium]|nr:hypothetical protein [Terrimicrobiaceae bacterium]
MSPEEQISKLLRLKRHEQPPPGYFEDFLRGFQARQRAELIRRPLWEIAWDRMASFAPAFQVPRMAYATVVALAVAASAMIVVHPGTSVSSGPLAANRSTLSLTSPQPVTIGESVPVTMTSTGSPSVHYVLPTRPVSYASSRSF